MRTGKRTKTRRRRRRRRKKRGAAQADSRGSSCGVPGTKLKSGVSLDRRSGGRPDLMPSAVLAGASRGVGGRLSQPWPSCLMRRLAGLAFALTRGSHSSETGTYTLPVAGSLSIPGLFEGRGRRRG
eukprot:7180226-Pyramimonas_sp.AAC.1